MLDQIKDRIIRISKAAGIEITQLSDNTYKIELIILRLEKKQVKIVKKLQWETVSLNVLKDQIEQEVPVNLAINGKGILHKKIIDSGTYDKTIVQSLLPNAKEGDFYIQKHRTDKNTLVSIVRRDQLDLVLDNLQKQNLNCTSVTLGGIEISTVLPFIEDAVSGGNFSWGSHELELDRSGEITDYKTRANSTNEKCFQLDKESIEEKYLIAYAAAFGFLIKNNSVPPFVEKVVNNKEEFLNGQLFKKLSWSVLVSFLIILIVNFVLFTEYSSKNNELVQKEGKYASMLSQIAQLDKEVKDKESFLSEAGWLKSSYVTYFGDRIAATVPGSVKLTELSINPLDERKSKEFKKEVFATGTILIKGDCTRPTELNEWLDKIKTIEKIGKAKLLHYTFDNKENKGTFSIEIITN